MMQHLQKFSSTMSDISATRKDLENTLLKLEGKISTQNLPESNIFQQTKLIRLPIFIIFYGILIIMGLYFCGISIHNLVQEDMSKTLLHKVDSQLSTIEDVYHKLSIFFNIATHDHITKEEISLVVSQLTEIYAFHLGFPLTNDTILSVLSLNGESNGMFKYKDTVFVSEFLFQIVNDISERIVGYLPTRSQPKHVDNLVTISKLTRGSAELRRSFYFLIMYCRFGENPAMESFLRHLHYAKGQFKSLFLREEKNATNLIDAIEMLITKIQVIEYEMSASNISCVDRVQNHFSVSESDFALQLAGYHVKKQIQIRKRSITSFERDVLAISLLALLVIIIVLVYGWVYKKKLEQVEDYKFCDSLLEDEVVIEKDFFAKTLSDIIPNQLIATAKLSPLSHKRRYKPIDDVLGKMSVISSASYRPSRTSAVRFPRTVSHHRKPSSLAMKSRNTSVSVSSLNPNFQEATVMMIDVVNFNSLLDYLNVDEAVNIVTYLTRLVDDRASYYDVFVATKGTSSYTIISGFTEDQRFHHASQIANLALDVVVSCGDLEIDRVPDSKLRLRIGIHTESCCAMVYPEPKARFRIYGDILNVVKVLQKTSYPNKIQISEETYKILARDLVYTTTKRGYVDLKNGRKMCTYWLQGKRVSVVSIAPEYQNFRRRSTIVNPVELEQKPLYAVDSDDGIPPVWTHAELFNPDDPNLPNCSSGRSWTLNNYGRRYTRYSDTLTETEETEF